MFKLVPNSDIDFVETALERLKKDWHNIETAAELWRVVNKPLTDIGCEGLVFFLNPINILKDRNTMPVQFFQAGPTPSLLQIDIDDAEMDSLIKNMDFELDHQFSSFPSLIASPFDPFSDLKPLHNHFKKDKPIYASRQFGSNLFSSYAVFKIRKDIAFNYGVRANIMSVLLNAIHTKLFDIYFAKSSDTVRVTPREKQVLQRLVRGETNNEMAKALNISPHTINSYITVISLKLKSANRTHTALKAIALGLVKI